MLAATGSHLLDMSECCSGNQTRLHRQQIMAKSIKPPAGCVRRRLWVSCRSSMSLATHGVRVLYPDAVPDLSHEHQNF